MHIVIIILKCIFGLATSISGAISLTAKENNLTKLRNIFQPLFIISFTVVLILIIKY